MTPEQFNRTAGRRWWQPNQLPAHLREHWQTGRHREFAAWITRFQQLHGLPADGMLGRDTAARLLRTAWLRRYPIQGKGVFIWRLQHLADVSRTAARVQAAGMAHVLVKIADGRMAMNDTIAQDRRHFERRGVAVFPWVYPYVYPRRADLEEQIRLHLSWFRRLGAQAVVVNAEAGFKSRQRIKGRWTRIADYRQQAARYMQALRAANLTVYLSSYCYTNQSGFPWRAVAGHADVLCPQTYWSIKRVDPLSCLSRSVAEWRAHASDKQFAPSGGCHQWRRSTNDAWRPYHSPAEITQFIAQATAFRLPAASFWLYSDIELDEERVTAAQWRALAAARWW